MNLWKWLKKLFERPEPSKFKVVARARIILENNKKYKTGTIEFFYKMDQYGNRIVDIVCPKFNDMIDDLYKTYSNSFIGWRDYDEELPTRVYGGYNNGMSLVHPVNNDDFYDAIEQYDLIKVEEELPEEKISLKSDRAIKIDEKIVHLFPTKEQLEELENDHKI